jgi:hypothetical protein
MEHLSRYVEHVSYLYMVRYMEHLSRYVEHVSYLYMVRYMEHLSRYVEHISYLYMVAVLLGQLNGTHVGQRHQKHGVKSAISARHVS